MDIESEDLRRRVADESAAITELCCRRARRRLADAVALNAALRVSRVRTPTYQDGLERPAKRCRGSAAATLDELRTF